MTTLQFVSVLMLGILLGWALNQYGVPTAASWLIRRDERKRERK